MRLLRALPQIPSRIAQKIINDWGWKVYCKIQRGEFPFNEKGFGGGGGGDIPAVSAPPAIAPSPVPTETKPGSNLEGRQRQVALLKYGSLATVTNQGGSGGITGTGSDFYPSMTPGTQGRQTTGGS